VKAGGAHGSDAPYHSAPSVGRAVLCAPNRDEDACALQELREICMHFRIGFTKSFGEW